MITSEKTTPEQTGSLIARGGIGGLLMGLANLVPGISGGTMLLAAGVYPAFIRGIAEITTFRFRWSSMVLLGSVIGSAGMAIFLLAGTVRDLVIHHRWIMYSLFIGLTLGGVPLVLRLLKPVKPAAWGGAAAGIILMGAMAWLEPGQAGGSERNMAMLFVAGIAGASAMILPGISGGYLLLILGQYLVILGAIDQMKTGLLGDSAAGVSRDLSLALDALYVVVPVGIGVVVGMAGVSNLLRFLLARCEQATLGVLLGLLLGSVLGLWPFQQAVEPAIGSTVRGEIVTAENVSEIDPEDWPTQHMAWSEIGPGRLAGSGGLILVGLGLTLAISRLGRGPEADRVS